jgi:hypothetical protein
MPAEDLPNPTLFTSQSRDPGFPHPPAAGAAGGGGENPRLAGEKREETGVASLTTVHGGEKRGPIVFKISHNLRDIKKRKSKSVRVRRAPALSHFSHNQMKCKENLHD